MQRKIKVFVIYFPVILITGQVLVNLLSFVCPAFYVKAGFILNTLFGVNALFALFLLAFTYWFKFCSVSRYAAWAEVLFAINFLVIQQDNLYNIMFQIIVGFLALILTFRHFVCKFPLCSVSLFLSFLSSLFTTGSCSSAIDRWDRITYHKIHLQHDRNKR
jgi:hypothetical protein